MKEGRSPLRSQHSALSRESLRKSSMQLEIHDARPLGIHHVQTTFPESARQARHAEDFEQVLQQSVHGKSDHPSVLVRGPARTPATAVGDGKDVQEAAAAQDGLSQLLHEGRFGFGNVFDWLPILGGRIADWPPIPA